MRSVQSMRKWLFALATFALVGALAACQRPEPATEEEAAVELVQPLSYEKITNLAADMAWCQPFTDLQLAQPSFDLSGLPLEDDGPSSPVFDFYHIEGQVIISGESESDIITVIRGANTQANGQFAITEDTIDSFDVNNDGGDPGDLADNQVVAVDGALVEADFAKRLFFLDNDNASQGDSNQDNANKDAAVRPVVVGLHAYTQSDPDVSVWTVIEALLKAAKDLSIDTRVLADPNYVVNPMNSDPSGADTSPPDVGGLGASPFDVGASPFDVGASPFDVGASPFDVGASPSDSEDGIRVSTQDSELKYWEQWAFYDEGIRLLNSSGQNNRLGFAAGNTGEDVRVGVFDTSPFENSGAYRFPLSQHAQYSAMDLCVSNSPSVPRIDDHRRARDHGLFVSGLTYAVAPQSQTHLIQVLNANGQGDLWTLIKAFDAYMDQSFGQPTVINLSLGFNPEASATQSEVDINEEDGILAMHNQLLYEDLLDLSELPSGRSRISSEDELLVASLEILISRARNIGMVVVAASGNDGLDIAEVPARWDTVIGVGATTKNLAQACFSNPGDVYAPGADGGDTTTEPPLICVPQHYTCADAACEFGLLSVVTRPTKATEDGFSYGFWAGTSFSTPLVSGLAALHLENGAIPIDIITRLTSASTSVPSVTKPVP